MVAWLCGWLRDQGWRVAIVSRGYGQLESGSNDEALELELALPDVPHLQNPDRYAAASLAHEELDMQFVVLDDGFQHRRLKRDLDIVLIDASEPSAADWCLPGGLMREPWSGLRRAGIVVLTRSNLATPERLLQLSKRVAQFAPRALCVSSQTRPVGWHGLQLPFATLDALQGRRVLAVCGIGSPAAFLAYARAIGRGCAGTSLFSRPPRIQCSRRRTTFGLVRFTQSTGCCRVHHEGLGQAADAAPGSVAVSCAEDRSRFRRWGREAERALSGREAALSAARRKRRRLSDGKCANSHGNLSSAAMPTSRCQADCC